MSEETDKSLDKIAEEQAKLVDGLEAEVKDDVEKAKGDGGQQKRPWWKILART